MWYWFRFGWCYWHSDTFWHKTRIFGEDLRGGAKNDNFLKNEQYLRILGWQNLPPIKKSFAVFHWQILSTLTYEFTHYRDHMISSIFWRCQSKQIKKYFYFLLCYYKKRCKSKLLRLNSRYRTQSSKSNTDFTISIGTQDLENISRCTLLGVKFAKMFGNS